MESFHSLLQNNVLDTKKWETRDKLRVAIVTWIERTYHRRRRKRSLGRMRQWNLKPCFRSLTKRMSRHETMESSRQLDRQQRPSRPSNSSTVMFKKVTLDISCEEL
jgi:hypothetical protein